MSISQLSQQEGLRIGQAKLAAATEGYLASKKAAKAMRLIVAPKVYQQAHLLMTECIQLLEQGFGEMKSYVELRLSGIVYD